VEILGNLEDLRYIGMGIARISIRGEAN